MDEAYLKVLQMIQNGTISAEAGEKLLDALSWGKPENGTFTAGGAKADESEPLPVGPPPWVHRVWVYPLAAGVVLIGLAGMATSLLVQVEGGLGWLACTLPLMIFGALVVALASWSRTARWLHVRVRDQETRFNFSLPLPLRPAACLARLAGPWVPQLRDTPIDELILSLAEVEDEGTLAVELGEGEGEEVQIYFG